MIAKEVYQTNVYQIKLKESPTAAILNMVDGMVILSQGNGGTVLVGQFVDQSALRGLLNQLWNLNLTILSIERIKSDYCQDIDR